MEPTTTPVSAASLRHRADGAEQRQARAQQEGGQSGFPKESFERLFHGEPPCDFSL
jgi:hypothetical protein